MKKAPHSVKECGALCYWWTRAVLPRRPVCFHPASQPSLTSGLVSCQCHAPGKLLTPPPPAELGRSRFRVSITRRKRRAPRYQRPVGRAALVTRALFSQVPCMDDLRRHGLQTGRREQRHHVRKLAEERVLGIFGVSLFYEACSTSGCLRRLPHTVESISGPYFKELLIPSNGAHTVYCVKPRWRGSRPRPQ
jgi:hypothetical protein